MASDNEQEVLEQEYAEYMRNRRKGDEVSNQNRGNIIKLLTI